MYFIYLFVMQYMLATDTSIETTNMKRKYQSGA